MIGLWLVGRLAIFDSVTLLGIQLMSALTGSNFGIQILDIIQRLKDIIQRSKYYPKIAPKSPV